MFSIFSTKTPRMLGLDISASKIKLLELSKKGEQYHIESYSVESLPPEAVHETEIKDIEVVGQAIAQVVKQSRTYLTKAAVFINSSAVISKIVQINYGLKESELASQVLIEAENHIPYPLSEVNLDFQTLGMNAKNPQLIDVLLVGTKTENIDTRIEVLALGGLKTQIVDVEAYVIERAFDLIRHQLPTPDQDKVVAIVDIGAVMMTLSVLHNGRTIYIRDKVFGGQQLTEAIQQRYHLSVEQAMLAKQEGGLPDDYEMEVLKPFIFFVSQQIARSLQFFFSASTFRAIDYMVLAGGSAMMNGLVEALEKHVGVPIILADPIANMTIASKVNVARIRNESPALLMCCGLAMRSFV